MSFHFIFHFKPLQDAPGDQTLMLRIQPTQNDGGSLAKSGSSSQLLDQFLFDGPLQSIVRVKSLNDVEYRITCHVLSSGSYKFVWHVQEFHGMSSHQQHPSNIHWCAEPILLEVAFDNKQ
jgi:hypothetical protein